VPAKSWRPVCAVFLSDATFFYLPLDDGIDVVRVLHGARDIDAMFNPEP
jgi:plasmid stabilization system protein ParE